LRLRWRRLRRRDDRSNADNSGKDCREVSDHSLFPLCALGRYQVRQGGDKNP
jgi:hypothetical protein